MIVLRNKWFHLKVDPEKVKAAQEGFVGFAEKLGYLPKKAKPKVEYKPHYVFDF